MVSKRRSPEAFSVNNVFRCYAYGRGLQWQALCIDLDLAVRGSSFQEVKASLAKAIDMYLETMTDLPADEQRQLLPRRSPRHVRTRLHVLAWLHGICGMDNLHRVFTHDRTISAAPV